jgi:D-amino-acid dehydrogenase
MLCRTPQALHEESIAALKARQLGVPADVLEAPDVSRLDPGIDVAVCGAVHYPQDCHLRPDHYAAVLQQRAANAGARFLWNTTVEGWLLDHGRLTGIRTDAGPIQGDAFVLCGGVWSDAVVRPLGLRLPMQAGKGYAVTVPHPIQLPQLCSILTEARVAVTPMNGSLRFGGTMELAGLDESINRRRVEAILRAATRYFPAFRLEHFEGLETWHGLRPVSPDGLPYLGRTHVHPNLIVATGHAMMGLSLAPVTGDIVARLAADQDPGFDLAPLRPERFA